MFMILIFFVKTSPKMQEIAFRSFRALETQQFPGGEIPPPRGFSRPRRSETGITFSPITLKYAPRALRIESFN